MSAFTDDAPTFSSHGTYVVDDGFVRGVLLKAMRRATAHATQNVSYIRERCGSADALIYYDDLLRNICDAIAADGQYSSRLLMFSSTLFAGRLVYANAKAGEIAQNAAYSLYAPVYAAFAAHADRPLDYNALVELVGAFNAFNGCLDVLASAA